MLVRMASGAATGPVRMLADWMSKWSGSVAPQGVAVFDVGMTSRGADQHLDAVVWTPACCVVIEVEHYAEALSGELVIPLNGPWTVDGHPVRFSGADERTPLDQSRDNTFALQNWFADNQLGQHSVRGVVLVVPPSGTDLRLTLHWTDPSFTVMLGDSDARLRDYFQYMTQDARETWTANDVAKAFHALDMGMQLPGPDELLAEGFLGPVDTNLWPEHETRHLRARPQAAADAGPAAAAVDPLEPTMPTRLPYSPWVIYPRVPGEHRPGHAVLRLILALGMLISFIWIVWFAVSALMYV